MSSTQAMESVLESSGSCALRSTMLWLRARLSRYVLWRNQWILFLQNCDIQLGQWPMGSLHDASRWGVEDSLAHFPCHAQVELQRGGESFKTETEKDFIVLGQFEYSNFVQCGLYFGRLWSSSNLWWEITNQWSSDGLSLQCNACIIIWSELSPGVAKSHNSMLFMFPLKDLAKTYYFPDFRCLACMYNVVLARHETCNPNLSAKSETEGSRLVPW